MTTRRWAAICLATAFSAGCQSMDSTGTKGTLTRRATSPPVQKAATSETKEYAGKQASYAEPIEDKPTPPKRASGTKPGGAKPANIFATQDDPDDLRTKTLKRRAEKRRKQQQPSLLASIFAPKPEKSKTIKDFFELERPR